MSEEEIKSALNAMVSNKSVSSTSVAAASDDKDEDVFFGYVCAHTYCTCKKTSNVFRGIAGQKATLVHKSFARSRQATGCVLAALACKHVATFHRRSIAFY